MSAAFSKSHPPLLTEESAAAIKHSDELTRSLVQRYGVSRTVIKQIRNGTIWRHVP